MPGGTYTLLIELESGADIEVGALGTREFQAGWYAYTGSALGPGGFARVDRHRRLASGDHDARHWHVDYLLAAPAASIEAVGRSPGLDAECAIAREIGGELVPGFGASDCGCDSHLAVSSERRRLVDRIREVHERFRE